MPTMLSNSSADARLKTELNEALVLARTGKGPTAIARLVALAKTYPESGPLLGVLAKLCFEGKDFRSAAKWFRRTTTASPKSELASLGLFHSLWKLDRRSDALSEISRFLLVTDSDEYTRILRELAKAGDLAVRRRSVAVA